MPGARPFDNDGAYGGGGGAGGLIAPQFDGQVNSAGDGLLIQSLGGTGGTGDMVRSGADAHGAAGGQGGAGGGTATNEPLGLALLGHV